MRLHWKLQYFLLPRWRVRRVAKEVARFGKVARLITKSVRDIIKCAKTAFKVARQIYTLATGTGVFDQHAIQDLRKVREQVIMCLEDIVFSFVFFFKKDESDVNWLYITKQMQ